MWEINCAGDASVFSYKHQEQGEHGSRGYVKPKGLCKAQEIPAYGTFLQFLFGGMAKVGQAMLKISHFSVFWDLLGLHRPN